ncbi:hypothetical protein FLACOL7796_01679 [Flavobacterium collinsii]|jgi:hypothetical protein|uniref:Uncharacterized protein n=1 Tax=Flavobacterium collinsii TaxID=1114861 RepID=A0ABN7EJD0_9FLAO|nr:hypothetical protein FLACOL7796_01679 [Flavobacterium collinsii]
MNYADKNERDRIEIISGFILFCDIFNNENLFFNRFDAAHKAEVCFGL